MATPFFIKQVWPGQSDAGIPRIKTGEHDRIVWIPDGPNRPSVSRFEPPGYLSPPKHEGAKRVSVTIEKKPPTPIKITYEISTSLEDGNFTKSENGTTTAQLELEPDSN